MHKSLLKIFKTVKRIGRNSLKRNPPEDAGELRGAFRR